MRPLLVGGPQEDGRRAGTENLPGVLAMVAALQEREQQIRESLADRVAIRTSFEAALSRALPGPAVIGEAAERLWNTVSVLMPEAPDCRQRWVVKLDKLGFAVSTGSACASGKEQPSHVLAAMGYTPQETGRVLRLSSGWETRSGSWLELLDGLIRATAEMQRLRSG
jgi:cysteine desulfurase